MKLRGTPRSRRAICCSSSPSTRGLWRRRVAWVSFIFSRSRHHPQSLQVVSSAAGLELLLMLHQHQLRSPPVTIDEDRRVARRAVVRSRTHPHPQSPPLLLQLRTVGGHAAADAGISTGDTPSPQPNSAKRRSAARSARKHAGRQRAIRCHILAVLYVLRLRRRVRLRCALQDLEELSTAPGPVSKRDRSQRSSSASSVASSTRAADRPPSGSSSSAGSSSSVTFVIGCQRCDSRSKRVELCHPCEDEVAYHSTLDGQGYIPPPPSLCSAADAAAAREGARRPAKRRGSRWGPALLR